MKCAHDVASGRRTRLGVLTVCLVASLGIANSCATGGGPLPPGALGELIAYQIGTARGERPLDFAYRHACVGTRLGDRVGVDSFVRLAVLESRELRRRLTSTDERQMDRALAGHIIYSDKQLCDSILARPLTPRDSALLSALLANRKPER